ncbi:GTP pyrophosphokinase family protein [Thomasclavelia spiroformis DSM 1552]|uniref:RelA/SpoT domain protein n=1 Tax=Thomasclavelia spiroformis DSM 1552 TaxID=428126 RepID=B1C5G2_9FIRM|nr:GTP pyrophosphokinase [Thomasclavelia spiroformis]EDS73965.1 RelA/SpoT domain protein [Thomasclavelia spiroformis DSM 1552]UWO89681.1 GTP pyrophosphokinase family protein [Thomasclavelia spiroformis DSM 1552]
MNQKIDNILDEQKKFQQLMQPYKAAIKIIKIKLEIIDQNLEFEYGHSPIHNIQYRIKSPKSIINKLERKKLEKNIEGIKKINDISGLRVICNYINDIHYIAQLLILQEDVVLIKYNNYITYPKKNGYRSLHLIVTVPVYQNDLLINVPVEIQIRTIAMDCWASLEHELVYKADKKANEEIKQRLKKCAEMMEKTDLEMQKIYMELNHSWQ